MSDPILAILKYGLLGLLYVFVFLMIRSLVRTTRAGYAADGEIGDNWGGNPATVWVLSSPGSHPASLPLTPELTVGRSAQCDLPLPDDTFISQYHARFTLRDGVCYVEDLGSTNGTRLNGNRLAEPARVERGDRVSLGKTLLELRK